jgi:glycosyltransferase involved in cell wall biosynthesis
LKSFKKHRIDKVYAEFGPIGAAIMPVCKKMNLPLIVNFHGLDASVEQVLIDYEKQYKELFEYAEYIVAVSKLMKNRLIAMGAPSEKTVYTPCAPNDSFFNIEPTFAENAFVAIGRFVDKKAPYYTILAFRKVLDKFPDAKLYMCGDGLLHDMCVNLVNYFKMSDNVIFHGSVKPDFLKQLYGKVVGFVQHSITASNGDMEGTPVAVLEASAAGLPVVATKHAGIPDVIQHEKTGLLVEEHDVDTMATYMTALLKDRDYARTMGQAGRALIKSDFSMERHIGILNELLYK